MLGQILEASKEVYHRLKNLRNNSYDSFPLPCSSLYANASAALTMSRICRPFKMLRTHKLSPYACTDLCGREPTILESGTHLIEEFLGRFLELLPFGEVFVLDREEYAR